MTPSAFDDTNPQKPPRILIFDSGVGGLSVLGEISKRAPTAELIFACDNAAFPYGTLSESQLIARVTTVVAHLVQQEAPDLVVVACNTASTLVLDSLRQKHPIPFVGVVPAVKPAASISKTKVIGLLATPATVERSYTDTLISDFAPDCEIVSVGSSELVYIAEQKLRGMAPDQQLLESILAPLAEQKQLDAVVLACTHFPLLLDELQLCLNDQITWVDSGAAIARRVQSLLPIEAVVPDADPNPENTQKHRALMTAQDKNLNALSQHIAVFGLLPFEVLSI